MMLKPSRTSLQMPPGCWWRRVLVLLCCWPLLAVSLPAQEQAVEEPAAKEQHDDAAAAEEKPAEKQAADGSKTAVLIQVRGVVSAMMKEYIERKLEKAKSLGADVVVLEIDSPGGEIFTMFEIVDVLRNVDWAHTVAYVPRDAEALSAASIISLATDEIVLHPDARFGDAGVIYAAEGAFRYVEGKLLSDVILRVRKLAEEKGRPPALAEAMVNRKCEVYRVRNRKTGEELFLSDKDIEASDAPEDWERLRPVKATMGDVYLEVDGNEAVKLELASATARNVEELMEHLGVEKSPIVLDKTWIDGLVYWLNQPFVTVLLFVLGAVCLYMELQVPGIGIFGLSSLLCFGLFFWSRILGGTADMLEVVLFAAGVLFILAELFIIPGFGLSGMAGALMILVSIILAGQNSVIPRTPTEQDALVRSVLQLGGSGFLFAIVALLLGRHFGRFPLLNKIILAPPEPQSPPAEPVGEEFAEPAAEMSEFTLADLIGQQGETITFLRPAGRARIGEKVYNVVTDGEIIEPGKQVKVLEVQGHRVLVTTA